MQVLGKNKLSKIALVLGGLLGSASAFAVDCNNIIQTGVPRPQCQALVDLYNSTNGANWTNKTNWMSTSPISTWYGVTVISANVAQVSLSTNNMAGPIPSSIGNLNKLTSLILDNNNLNGPTPSTIGNLTQLTILYLQNVRLTGSIPSSIGNLTQLRVLTLANNNITGSIPSTIGNLTQLVILNLNNNWSLSGTIPSSIGNLTQLEQLGLSGNVLSGTVPSSIGNLIKLNYLNLSGNNLSGTIPSSIGNLIRMNFLFLAGNQLSGGIPNGIGSMAHLQGLALNYNRLGGALPAWLGSLPLDYLDLSNNSFTGELTSSQLSSTLGGANKVAHFHQNCLNDVDAPTIIYLTNLAIADFIFYPQKARSQCPSIKYNANNTSVAKTTSATNTSPRYDSAGNRIVTRSKLIPGERIATPAIEAAIKDQQEKAMKEIMEKALTNAKSSSVQ